MKNIMLKNLMSWPRGYKTLVHSQTQNKAQCPFPQAANHCALF